jgi:hypothetical protein
MGRPGAADARGVEGAKLHCFSRYLPEFGRLLASAQLVGDAAR